MKHTPGPWTASIGEAGAHIHINNDYNHPLSFGFQYGDDTYNEEIVAQGKANARLIAQAPKMLEAIKIIVANAENMAKMNATDLKVAIGYHLLRLENLIAEVEGE